MDKFAWAILIIFNNGTIEQISKLEDLKDLTSDSLSDRMRYSINEGKLVNKNNLNAVFYYINQKIFIKLW